MEAFHQKLRENIETICATDPHRNRKSRERRLNKIKNQLSESETGNALLQWADKHKITIAFDPQMPSDLNGVYYYGAVVLSTELSNEALVPILAHELRHAWQDTKHMVPYHGLIDLDEYRAATTIIEADAFAIQLQVCHELAQKGMTGPLDFMENDPEAQDFYGKAIHDYANAAIEHPDNIQNGQAMQAGFWGWMQSHARYEYDHTCLDFYADTMQLIQDHKDRDKLSLCDLPDDAEGLSRYFTKELLSKARDRRELLPLKNNISAWHKTLKQTAGKPNYTNYTTDVFEQNIQAVLDDLHPMMKKQYRHIQKMCKKHQDIIPKILHNSAM